MTLAIITLGCLLLAARYLPAFGANSTDGENAELLLNPVFFNLYTNKNPHFGQLIAKSGISIKFSHFNKKNPTRFIIHGYVTSYLNDSIIQIRRAWLSKGDYNVIVVAWPRSFADYNTSVRAVPGVGRQVADMIKFLNEQHGMSLDTLIVIGHSLGAQISGFAGQFVGNAKINTIVGLDPALPLFENNEPSQRLDATDAFYVESIQTNGGQFGFLKPVGKAAFYPNGGQRQPVCDQNSDPFCSHNHALTYYAEAVRLNDFGTIQCDNYENAIKKQCGNTFTSIRMGAVNNNELASGVYYVPVNSNAPFGKTN